MRKSGEGRLAKPREVQNAPASEGGRYKGKSRSKDRPLHKDSITQLRGDGGGGDYGGGDVDGVAVEEAAEALDGFVDG